MWYLLVHLYSRGESVTHWHHIAIDLPTNPTKKMTSHTMQLHSIAWSWYATMLAWPSPCVKFYPPHFSVLNPQEKHGGFSCSAQPAWQIITVIIVEATQQSSPSLLEKKHLQLQNWCVDPAANLTGNEFFDMWFVQVTSWASHDECYRQLSSLIIRVSVLWRIVIVILH